MKINQKNAYEVLFFFLFENGNVCAFEKKPAIASITARERAVDSKAGNRNTKFSVSVSHSNNPDICKKRSTEEHSLNLRITLSYSLRFKFFLN